MTDYEKLKKLIADTDELIKKDILLSSPEFDAWNIRTLRLINGIYGQESFEAKNIRNISYSPLIFSLNSPDYIYINACRKGLVKAKTILETFLDDFNDEEETVSHTEQQTQNDMSKIFIVHGHDEGLKQSVARIIEKQSIQPIILSEKANTGRTIIEKVEKYSDVGCAICLFTADDMGREKSDKADKSRARQNVVFETGYFMGKLGRDHIVILSDSDVDIPSDLDGVVYTNTRNWEVDLLKELRAMGYQIDLNKL